MSGTDKKKAIVFMADGMEMCECLLTVDILRRAGVDVTTASVMKRREVTSSHKVMMYADVMAEDADYAAADLIVLPGGRIGTENLAANDIVRQQCLEFAVPGERADPEKQADSDKQTDSGKRSGKYLAAVCAAPSVFAGLGLLEGRKATCHPDFEDKVSAGSAELTHDSVTVDGNIVTGQGLGATMDFALKLAELLAGKEEADRIAAAICYRK